MGRPDRIGRVLLDASCLLGVIKGEPDMACLRSLLRAVERGEVVLVESTAIFVEVLPVHSDPTGLARRREILQLLESAEVELIDVTAVVARKAADLRRQYGLKTWDAVHLATAIVARADVLMMRDDKFPADTVVDGVYVTKPFDIDDDKLPLDD